MKGPLRLSHAGTLEHFFVLGFFSHWICMGFDFLFRQNSQQYYGFYQTTILVTTTLLPCACSWSYTAKLDSEWSAFNSMVQNRDFISFDSSRVAARKQHQLRVAEDTQVHKLPEVEFLRPLHVIIQLSHVLLQAEAVDKSQGQRRCQPGMICIAKSCKINLLASSAFLS